MQQRVRFGAIGFSLLQAGGEVFGMLLVALENLETSLQQALRLRVVRALALMQGKVGVAFCSLLSTKVNVSFDSRRASETYS